jgi:hypothetical protein
MVGVFLTVSEDLPKVQNLEFFRVTSSFCKIPISFVMPRLELCSTYTVCQTHVQGLLLHDGVSLHNQYIDFLSVHYLACRGLQETR